MSIEPTNLSAQLHYRAAGNPPSTLADSAISNCFPGLEFDFRNVWRRIFEGIEVHESNGLVTATTPGLERLLGLELVRVGDAPTLFAVTGPTADEPDALLGATFAEWSNVVAAALQASAGKPVTCRFAAQPTDPNALRDADPPIVETAELVIRPMFARSAVTGGQLALIDEALAAPGELTQSLCSPWQNDYRECACYYWAASRPDFVNRESSQGGVTIGNDWMSRERVPKEYDGPELLDYVDLFRDWQGLLRFIVGGRDHE